MKSARHGSNTSAAEVVQVTSHGLWILLEPPGRELYLPFSCFPWFKDATIRQLSHIEMERPGMLRWPDLDVDLDVDRIEHPERYPLVARATRRKARVTATSGVKRTRPRGPTAAE
jgi:hypothetical protein